MVTDVTFSILNSFMLGTGIVLGFGAARTKAIDGLAEKYKVTLLTNDVIYHLLEQLKVILLCNMISLPIHLLGSR